MVVVELLIVLLCVVGAAYFEAVETAVLASNRLRIRGLAGRGDRRAALVNGFLERPERFLGTVLLGGNICIIGGSVIATGICARALPPFWAAVVSTIGMTAVIVLFAEVLPKSVSLHDPEYFACAAARGLNSAIRILTPVTIAFTFAADVTLRVVGVRRRGRSPYVSREELRLILTERGGDAPAVVLEKEMIRRIFHFGETKVAQAMVPLVDVVSISEGAILNEAVRLIREYGYSRFPIYRERTDDVVGVIYARDLIGADPGSLVADYVRSVEFYPENISVEKTLDGLLASELKMAIVVDEYGGVVGLITLEDVVEEVVGEISDEHDRAVKEIVREGNELYVGGNVEIDSLNDFLPVPLPEEDYETVAGFIITRLERIPATGEVLEWPPYTFTVLSASARSIKRLKIRIPPASPKASASDN